MNNCRPKKKNAHLIRDPLSFWALFIFCAFSVVSFLVISFSKKEESYYHELNCPYENEFYLDVWMDYPESGSAHDNIRVLFHFLDGLSCEKCILSEKVDLENYGTVCFSVDFSDIHNDKLEKVFPIDGIGEGAVVDPELSPIIETKDGKNRILLSFREFPIIGVYEDRGRDVPEVSVMYEGVDDTLALPFSEALMEYGRLSVVLGTDSDISSQTRALIEWLEENGFRYERSSYSYFGIKGFYQTIYHSLFVITYVVFLLLTCFAVAFLFYRRRQEIQIRLFLGASHPSVFLIVFSEVLKAVVPAPGVGISFAMIILSRSSALFHRMGVSFGSFLVVMAIVLVTCFLGGIGIYCLILRGMLSLFKGTHSSSLRDRTALKSEKVSH